MPINTWKHLLAAVAVSFLVGSASAEPPARPTNSPAQAEASKNGTEAKRRELAESPGMIIINARMDEGPARVSKASQWRFTMANFPDSELIEGGRVELEISMDDFTTSGDQPVDETMKQFLFGSSDAEKVSVQVGSPRLIDVDEEGRQKYSAEGLLFTDGNIRPLPLEITVLERTPLRVHGTLRLEGEQLALYTRRDDLGEEAFLAIRFVTKVPELVVLRQTRRDAPESRTLPGVGRQALRQPQVEAPTKPEKQNEEVEE